jgi:hypothetical protein
MGALKDFIAISSAGVKDTYITGRFQIASDGSTIQQLTKVIGGFNKLCHIGSGGFGTEYSSCLEDGTLIAIRRASPSSLQGHAEFWNELPLLSSLHTNIN